jgi:cell division protein FtsQ
LAKMHVRENHYKNISGKKRKKILGVIFFNFKMLVGIIAIVFMSYVFIFSYDYITQCEYFRAKSITVSGVHRLSSDQVAEQADLKKNMNVLSINLSVARKKLLAHPLVKEAEIRRELPNDIFIKIKEHVPIAILDLGRRFLINTDGEIYKELGEADPDKLPIIVGLKFSDINIPGESRSKPFNAVMDILKLGSLPDSVLPNRLVRKIQVDREMGIVILPAGQIKKIKMGYLDFPSKYKKLRAVLSFLETRQEVSGFDSINLNNLQRVVVSHSRIDSLSGKRKEV